MNVRQKPLRNEDLVDGAALRAALTAAANDGGDVRSRALELLIAAWSGGRRLIDERFEAGEDGLSSARLRARLADEIVAALYDFTTTHLFRARNPTAGERLAIVAVGGYGRGELAPYSDLDLLFLRAYKPTPFAESVTEYMLYMLWDMGLKVGHASRSIADCLKIAKSDHTVETALLESRRIAGDEKLFEELSRRFRSEVAQPNRAAFIAAKLAERDQRHLRAGASRYMVEPNIKEGKGGLRDLHTLFWIARHRYGFETARDYVSAGVFTEEEASAFRRALRFLWSVRTHLHLVAGRAEERLTFDMQPELARRAGYVERRKQTDVERFMKRYFLVARQVGQLTRTLCASLEADNAKRRPRALNRLLPPSRKGARTEAPAGYRIEGGRLDIESPAVFDEPANMLRLFQIADERGLDIHPVALGEATKRLKHIGGAVRRDPTARDAFLSVVSSPRQPAAALALMNEAGVLGRFVPEFGRIVAQMQFNMYHHFTVDEHTLRGIEAISEIEKGVHKKQHPLATDIFGKIINRRALYLAMLLHDTGKGEGDQQIEGEKSARAACERLGLPEEEIELIAWLVRHHLEMSDIAQKRDISDPRTVADFARRVGSLEKLRLLLVLTVADIRAVGPGLWNDWKGQLLRDLYRLAEAVFHGGRSDEESVRLQLAEGAASAKQRVLEALSDAEEGVLAVWFAALEDGYWLSHDPDSLSWHAREVLNARAGRAIPHVATRVRATQGVTDVLIYAGDRPGLFASLAAAITSCGADIANARIYTTRDGAAFDVFSLQSTNRKAFGADDPRALARLVERLHCAALEDQKLPPAPPTPRRTAVFRIEPWVRIDNGISPAATVIEASGRDRPGLLAALARVLAEANVSISSAHLDPYGERVSDVFYVQEALGGQISNLRRIAALREKLEAVLRAAEPPAEAGKSALAVARASTAR
ncbi:MAG: [protein-PII] uridylyltransferase [Hyphomonadaceae bacterium]